jgi:outer membrane protein OmpA-like peptidoglycan-associated protein
MTHQPHPTLRSPLSLLSALALAAVLLASPLSFAEDNLPGVTDLSGADAGVIEQGDIISALAVPRNTVIRASAPPTLRLPVYFELDSAELRPDARDLLDTVGAALLADELQPFDFSLEGHTDDSGPTDYNSQLSSRRAESVRSYLVAQGIARDRLETVGRGEGNPIRENATADGRKRNRRVEIINLGVAE